MRSIRIKKAPQGWVQLSKSTQRLKIGPGIIIDTIQQGKVTRIGVHQLGHGYGYRAIYVYHEEVVAIRGNKPPPAQSIELFSKSVGVNQPSRMRRLIANGHLNATTIRNPRNNADQFYFTSKDALTFDVAFPTPRTIAITYMRSWQSVGAKLTLKNVKRFSPNGEGHGNLYLRRDVEAALN